MERLSKIAQSIFLGNGEVWNFLDYAVNRSIGGLLSYTKKNDFLRDNLINNFNGGYTPKYKRSDINSTNSYTLDRESSLLSLAKQGRGGDIGELYEVPTTTNSELSFIYPQELEDLWALLREENTVRNRFPCEYGEKTVEKYINEINDGEEPSIQDIGLYSDIARNFAEKQNNIVNPNIGYKKSSDDKYLWKYKYYHASPSHPFNYQHFNTKPNDRILRLKSKGILDVSYDIWYGTAEDRINGKKTLKDYIKQNEIIKERFSSPWWITNGSDIFYYKVDTDNVIEGEKISKNGIYELYIPNRVYNLIETPIFWNPYSTYGVNYGEYGIENYTTDREKYNGDAIIDSKFNGGNTSTYNTKTGVRTYSFYEEGGAEEMGNKPQFSDGSNGMISSYNDGSRLLRKTNELFKNAQINSLINRFHTDARGVHNETITAYDESYGLSRGRNLLRKDSNGNVIIDKSSGYDDPYCRVWTSLHQYSKLKDRIRPFVDDKGEPMSLMETQQNYGALRPNDGLTRLNDYSVLGADGFVKITPTHDSNGFVQKEDVLKNYMFSIENLAWRDITANENSTALSKEQIGPNKGRIMWFPPYNLKFTENVNVNWNSNAFIGRGEEIYTYTNTVRSGTLDFTLLIDHPSIINKWRGQVGSVSGEEKKQKEEELLRFFAGCSMLGDEITPQKEVKTDVKPEIPIREPKIETYTEDIAYVIFFPNNFSAQDYNSGVITTENKVSKEKIKYACEDILKNYNTGGAYSGRDESFKEQILKDYNITSSGFDVKGNKDIIRKTLFNSNDKIVDIRSISELIEIKKEFTSGKTFGHTSENCKIQKVRIKGFASSHGTEKNNAILSGRRQEFIKKALSAYSDELSPSNVKYVSEGGSTIKVTDIDGREDVNTMEAKLARAAYAIISIEWKKENVAHDGGVVNGFTANGLVVDKVDEVKDTIVNNMVSTTYTSYAEDEYTYDNEYLYFENVKNDNLIMKSILDKVKYFDPAYHSVTPEGFNARLTFLHQCTRQGPTNAVSSGRVKGVEKDSSGKTTSTGSDDYLKFAGNLSFGRAPYCILRIGDFFNTKICIDSMSINYDNNGGVQWDLNPEGVGVQPMYANISISFKFLGGQDISRPIERLQNAVTANYYANASVYSRHADNNRHYYDAFEDKEKDK